MKKASLFTRVVHLGMDQQSSADFHASIPAISPSVGYIYAKMSEASEVLSLEDQAADDPRFIYSRLGSPNVATLEGALAELECAEEAVAFSSGMAALHAALVSCLCPRGRILAAKQLYGATCSLLDHLSDKLEVQTTYVDFTQVDDVKSTIEEISPEIVLCEVITNPLCRVIPVNEVIASAKQSGAVTIIDNTFATPYLLQPITLGADMVVHSTTKALNGHGDVLGGVVAASHPFCANIKRMRKLLGAVPGAFDAWLTLRGLRTFGIRMRQACDNAARIAQFLSRFSPKIKVCYSGLPEDPDHRYAVSLFNDAGFGNMLAFSFVEAEVDDVFRFMQALKIIRPVTSLGDVYSLISHPASSSHRNIDSGELSRLGILPGTLRLSAGIEDADDLIGDIRQAMASI